MRCRRSHSCLLLADVTAADAIPVSQNGATHSVSVGALLASTQPAIISESGTLLGRISLGAGGPEPVAVGAGLLLNDGTLTASAFDPAGLPQQTTLSPTDHAMLNSNGLVDAAAGVVAARSVLGRQEHQHRRQRHRFRQRTAVARRYLQHHQPDAGDDDCEQRSGRHQPGWNGPHHQLREPARRPDDRRGAASRAGIRYGYVLGGTGLSTMLRPDLRGDLVLDQGQAADVRRPVVEITVNTTLDGTIHNGAILICSPADHADARLSEHGQRLLLQRVNLSGGNVTFGAGVITSSGTATLLPSGQAATAARCHLLRRHRRVRVAWPAAPVAALRRQPPVRSPA